MLNIILGPAQYNLSKEIGYTKVNIFKQSRKMIQVKIKFNNRAAQVLRIVNQDLKKRKKIYQALAIMLLKIGKKDQ